MDSSASVIHNLFVALLAIIGISGLGRLLIWPLRSLALHWYAAISMLAGFALTSVSIQCLAMAGTGRAGFQVAGTMIVAFGFSGHWICRKRHANLPMPPAGSFRSFSLSLLCSVLVLLVLIGLAPSTKIDELNYHMLVGRRILDDHRLRVYQLPVEQAIVPQMGYQIAETVFHATNAADAGNILSLGFGVTFWLLIYGVVAEETGFAELGLVAALTSAVGMYPAVFYVTAGAHTLGDLATFTGVAALFLPGGLAKGVNRVGDRTRAFICFLSAACAASTKISLVPVAAVITSAALFGLKGASARMKMGAVAAGLWLFLMAPLVTWTYIHTGSPFGAAFAQLFGQTAYQPAVLQALEDSRAVNQTGLGNALYFMFLFLNGGSLALILCGAVTCCRLWKRLNGLLFLVVLQVALIAWLLPHDFRFLGGLQYGLLAAGVLGLSPLLRTRVHFKWVAGASLLLLGPWLAVELYYARPFVATVVGASAREDFLIRYVAFMDDFRALDKILPRDATLYVPNNRMPAVYAPRPVIFTLADWDRRTPLYRLLVQPYDLSDLEPQTNLNCGREVYQNPDAVVESFRTPNRNSERGTVVVEPCLAHAGGKETLRLTR